MNIKLYGKVQGVGFRGFASSAAHTFGIGGFVRNEPDGSVYIQAEGEEKDLKRFLEECEKGPRGSTVEKMESQEGEVKGFLDFEEV